LLYTAGPLQHHVEKEDNFLVEQAPLTVKRIKQFNYKAKHYFNLFLESLTASPGQ
jgi:hypothetical protein